MSIGPRSRSASWKDGNSWRSSRMRHGSSAPRGDSPDGPSLAAESVSVPAPLSLARLLSSDSATATAAAAAAVLPLVSLAARRASQSAATAAAAAVFHRDGRRRGAAPRTLPLGCCCCCLCAQRGGDGIIKGALAVAAGARAAAACKSGRGRPPASPPCHLQRLMWVRQGPTHGRWWGRPGSRECARLRQRQYPPPSPLSQQLERPAAAGTLPTHPRRSGPPPACMRAAMQWVRERRGCEQSSRGSPPPAPGARRGAAPGPPAW